MLHKILLKSGSGNDSDDGGDNKDAAEKAEQKRLADEKAAEDAKNAAIEKARLEERQKLRKEIDDAKALVTQSDATAKEKAAEVDRLNAIVAAYDKAKTGGKDIDVKALVEEIRVKTREEVEAVYKNQLEQQGAQVRQLGEQLNSMQLKALKDRLIAEVGGSREVIMSLITGTDEASLRASIAASNAEVIRIREEALSGGKGGDGGSGDGAGDDGEGQDNTDTANKDDKRGGSAPPVLDGRSGGGQGRGRGGEIKHVKQLNSKDYAANRDKIMADLKQRNPPRRG